MSIFRRQKIQFTSKDPLDNGLSDDIAAEQQEPDAFTLEDMSGDELSEQWTKIISDAKKDPNWFSISKE